MAVDELVIAVPLDKSDGIKKLARLLAHHLPNLRILDGGCKGAGIHCDVPKARHTLFSS